MRTAIYIRVSTTEQADEGFSIPAQKEKLTSFVHSQDWDIHDFYIEEGKSAKDLNRPEMKRMIADMKNHSFDVVLVYKLDRLTRSVSDLHQLLNEFDKYNVKFKSATEVYDTTTAIGRLFITLVAALAQWERENIAERVYFGMEEMVLEGRRPGGRAPFGYDLVDQTLVINEKEAPIIRYIFNRYNQGIGKTAIAGECNNKGWRSKEGAKFHHILISDMLKNPVYYGALRWKYRRNNKSRNSNPDDWIVVENVYPAIITKQEYELAQEINNKRKNVHPRNLNENSTFIFSSVLRCARCGGKMSGHSQKWKDRDYVLYDYICVASRRKECNATIFPVHLVEEAFLKYLEQYVNEHKELAKETKRKKKIDKDTEIESLKREIKKIGEQRKRHQVAFSEGLIEIEELREHINELRSREDEIKKYLEQLGPEKKTLSKEEIVEYITSIKEAWQEASIEQKKQMVLMVVKKMVIDIPDEMRKKKKHKHVVIHSLDFY